MASLLLFYNAGGRRGNWEIPRTSPKPLACVLRHSVCGLIQYVTSMVSNRLDSHRLKNTFVPVLNLKWCPNPKRSIIYLIYYKLQISTQTFHWLKITDQRSELAQVSIHHWLRDWTLNWDSIKFGRNVDYIWSPYPPPPPLSTSLTSSGLPKHRIN